MELRNTVSLELWQVLAPWALLVGVAVLAIWIKNEMTDKLVNTLQRVTRALKWCFKWGGWSLVGLVVVALILHFAGLVTFAQMKDMFIG
jgi:hypothetical protein